MLFPDSTVTLNTGVEMPRLGFGVSEARDAEPSVSAALARGYRSIDTAAVYGTEEGVGAAIAASGLALCAELGLSLDDVTTRCEPEPSRSRSA